MPTEGLCVIRYRDIWRLMSVASLQPHGEGPFADPEWIGRSRPSPWPGHINCWVASHRSSHLRYSLQSDFHLTLFIPSNGCASLLTLSTIFPNYSSSAREINNPVVLIHGFADIPGLSGTWATVEEVLREEAGVPKSDILKVQIPPLKTIEERTKSAIRDITAKFPGKTVHLIAHSMVCSFPFPVVGIVD